MTPAEKVRYGMLAFGVAGVVLASFGLHIGPLDIIGSSGAG
jgi:hypothetical protein